MRRIYPLFIALGCLACSQQEKKTINALENDYYQKLGSFSGKPIEYIAESDTVYLTLQGKNGDYKSLWSILSDEATPEEFAQRIESENTDLDPSASHQIFHVSYLEVNGTNYMLQLAGQIGDIRYAERLIDFKSFNPIIEDQ